MPGARSPWSGVGTLRAIHYTHMDSHMTVALPVTHIILGEEFDTDERELDLVVYLAGSERTLEASERDVAEFRKSAHLSKWHAVTQ